MEESSVTLLAGAGASIPVGIPGMAGMAKSFSSSVTTKSPEQQGLSFLREFGASTDVEELLQLANAIVQFPDEGVSEFIRYCVRGAVKPAGLTTFSRRRNTVISQVKIFRTHLLEWITQECLAFDRVRAIDLYRNLVSTIAERRIPIFTTNYDAVLDYVATDLAIPVLDNFKQVGNQWFWDASLESFQGDGIRLIKLHGSVHWHAAPDGTIERLDPPAPRNSRGQRLERLLIVPTRFKDIYQRNYFPLYTRFLARLATTRTLIVLGHSLRDEYLLAAIRDRLRDPQFHVVVADPVLPAEDELDSGPGGQVVHLKGGVEDLRPLLEQLLRDVPERELFETARDAAKLARKIKKPKITISNFPPWVDGGMIYGIKINVKTAIGGVILRAHIDINGSGESPLDLTEKIRSAFPSGGRFDGFHDVTRTLRHRIPKSFEKGPHVLWVQLTDDGGSLIAFAKRKFTLMG